MSFFCHSFAARRERDHAVVFAAERDIATAALAGFTIEPDVVEGIWTGLYKTWSPSHEFLGYNASRIGAARYCLEVAGQARWPR